MQLAVPRFPFLGVERDRVMIERAIAVNPLVRHKIAHLGAQGQEWLAALPNLIGAMERQWSITVGQPLPGGTGSALARGYSRLLATQTGIDETAIWEWGFLERVSTGLYVLEFGAEDFGRSFLDTAELLV